MQVLIRLFANSEVTEPYVKLNTLPDTCPICNKSGEIIYINGFANKHKQDKQECMQAVLQCPRISCKRFFIAYYSPTNDLMKSYTFNYVLPKFIEPREFPEAVVKISPDFVAIYNQAEEAEAKGLDKITGVGYRKSLEFLIKDYLIQKNPEKEAGIKAKQLGKCISEDVEDTRIKSVSKRATWLGNDETHYIRLWDGKDVHDLKMLIDLTIYWINSEHLTAQLEKDMPEKSETEPANTKQSTKQTP